MTDSSARIERLRRSVESWSNGVGDFSTLPDLYHQDMELCEVADWPEAAVHRGLRAFEAYWRQFAERFEVTEGSAEQLLENGDSVLAYLRCKGHERAGGHPLDLQFAVIYTFRDDMISRVEPFLDRAKAYEAWRARAAS
jgi:ketosteroid isomerase-like protein